MGRIQTRVRWVPGFRGAAAWRGAGARGGLGFCQPRRDGALKYKKANRKTRQTEQEGRKPGDAGWGGSAGHWRGRAMDGVRLTCVGRRRSVGFGGAALEGGWVGGHLPVCKSASISGRKRHFWQEVHNVWTVRPNLGPKGPSVGNRAGFEEGAGRKMQSAAVAGRGGAGAGVLPAPQGCGSENKNHDPKARRRVPEKGVKQGWLVG